MRSMSSPYARFVPTPERRLAAEKTEQTRTYPNMERRASPLILESADDGHTVDGRLHPETPTAPPTGLSPRPVLAIVPRKAPEGAHSMGRTLIVGDVHGCRAELDQLLDRAGFTTGDQLVFVGDLVARGPDSLGVLDIVRRTGALVVRGNHEEKILEWRREVTKEGGRTDALPLGRLHAEVARELRPVDWSLLSSSPLWLDLPEHRARVVHAGLVPGVPIEAQKKKTLLRIRMLGEDGTPIAARDGGKPWAAGYRGPPHVVFGHNASPELQLHRWATGIDTGCVYGGRLTALVLAEGQPVPKDLLQRRGCLLSVPARRAYAHAPQYARRVA